MFMSRHMHMLSRHKVRVGWRHEIRLRFKVLRLHIMHDNMLWIRLYTLKWINDNSNKHLRHICHIINLSKSDYHSVSHTKVSRLSVCDVPCIQLTQYKVTLLFCVGVTYSQQFTNNVFSFISVSFDNYFNVTNEFFTPLPSHLFSLLLSQF